MRAHILDFSHEVEASATLPSEDQGREDTTFSEEDMSTLHRFLGQPLQPPEAGFRTTAPDLARQLHE